MSAEVRPEFLTLQVELGREQEFCDALDVFAPRKVWSRAHDNENKAAAYLRERCYLRAFRRCATADLPKAIVALSLIGPALFGARVLPDDGSWLELPAEQHNWIQREFADLFFGFIFVDFDFAYGFHTPPKS